MVSATCTDLRLVERMINLKSLRVFGLVAQRPDLTHNSNLTEFAGPLKGFESVLDLPTLTTLHLTTTSGRRRVEISAPVEFLRIDDIRGLTELPVLRHPMAVRDLSLHRTASLDVSGADELRHLRRLSLSSVRKLTGVDPLVRLRLEFLHLEDCREIHPVDALLELRDTEVRVVGHNAFSERFRTTALGSRRADWSFPVRRGRRA